ncbi:hypothetical protein ACOMHN_043078 [Nucella lapillus]
MNEGFNGETAQAPAEEQQAAETTEPAPAQEAETAPPAAEEAPEAPAPTEQQAAGEESPEVKAEEEPGTEPPPAEAEAAESAPAEASEDAEAVPEQTAEEGEAQAEGKATEVAGEAAPGEEQGEVAATTEGGEGEQEEKKEEGDGEHTEAPEGEKAEGEQGEKAEGEEGEKAEGEQGEKVEGEQGEKAEGEQGEKVEGEQGEKAEGEQGEKAEGEQGEKAEGEQGEKAEGEQGEKAEGEQGEKKEGEEGEGEAKPEGEGKEKPEGEDGGEGEGGAAAVEGAEGEEKAEGEAGEEVEKPAEGEEEAKSPVPQSETFTEGERPESPSGVQVGEKLSRSPTPTEVNKGQDGRPEILEPGTPERIGSEADLTRAGALEVHAEEPEGEEEEEEEELPVYDRDELIEKYHMGLADREGLLQQNFQLQHKLAEYFRKKKNDERQEYDKNVTDQEQRYLKYMAQLDELHHQDQLEHENYQRQMEDMKGRCEERRSRVDDERTHFVEFKKQVALNSINSRSGKPIAPKDIEQYLITENKKEAEVVNVRLENIKLKNKLKKKEQHLKSKEELAEGLHLIDFEQLKIENQTYNEKIEERNEELLKLRKKITSTVQVLTHLKEKLQFVQGENHIHNRKLQDVEVFVAQKRDVLSHTKQARDSLRIDNQRLRQNCGLLGNEPLLRDFEDRKDEGDDLKAQLDHLKMQHAELTLNCNGVRRKIEQVRGSRH